MSSQNLRIIFFSVVLTCIVALGMTCSAQAQGACDPATVTHEVVVANSLFDSGAADGLSRLRIPAPEPGFFELYLSVRGDAPQPRFAVATDGCGDVGSTWQTLRETPRAIHGWMNGPGDLWVEVRPQQEGAALPRFELRATFVPDRVPAAEETLVLTADSPTECQPLDLPALAVHPTAEQRAVQLRGSTWTKDVDPWEEDPISGLTAAGIWVIEAPNNDVDVALHQGGGCDLANRIAEQHIGREAATLAVPVHAGVKRLWVHPRQPGASYEIELRHADLCSASSEPGDDHGDRPLCGTELPAGEWIGGRIDSSQDEDHFTFLLETQETVEIELAGPIGLTVELFDEAGQRLESWTVTTEAIESWTRTLGQGRFHARIAEYLGADYSMRFRSLP